MNIYTVQNAPSYQSMDLSKANLRAKEQALKDKRKISIYENGAWRGRVNVYTIENDNHIGIDRLEAIQRAKEVAMDVKAKVKIFKNGNPLYMVDRKGNLAAA